MFFFFLSFFLKKKKTKFAELTWRRKKSRFFNIYIYVESADFTGCFVCFYDRNEINKVKVAIDKFSAMIPERDEKKMQTWQRKEKTQFVKTEFFFLFDWWWKQFFPENDKLSRKEPEEYRDRKQRRGYIYKVRDRIESICFLFKNSFFYLINILSFGFFLFFI